MHKKNKHKLSIAILLYNRLLRATLLIGVIHTLFFTQVNGETLARSERLETASLKITGVVTDSTGVKIAGVSIANRNTGKATSSNLQGEFTIDGSEGDLLTFSSIGYKKQEVRIGIESKLSIILIADNGLLDQVVVTALGVKKSVRALNYNVQEIKNAELTRVPDASFVNALSGKVAGVTINASASGIGGSTRVIMRGAKSLSGNNNALYVLDGIPLPNLFSSKSTTIQGKFAGRGETGDGISSINPEDIESVSVLTGASAAAIYGSMAANGVILVNTKKGKENTSINFANSSTFYRPFIMPKLQNAYGASSPGAFDSWSNEKMGFPSTYNPKDYLQTGNNISNNISIATGSDKNQTYFSAASLSARGIIPNNEFKRYNLTLHNTTSYLDDKLKLDLNLMYINLENQNAITQGMYGNPLVSLYLFPVGDDMEKYHAYERYDITRNFDTQFWPTAYQFGQNHVENPFWVMNRESFVAKKQRYMLSAGLNYQVLTWLNAQARVRMDDNKMKTDTKYHASTDLLFANSANGYYGIGNENTRQTYADLLLSSNNNFQDFNLKGMLGASLMNTKYGASGSGGGLASISNLFTLNNVAILTGNQTDYYDQTQAIYASGELGYKNQLFLTVTGRNEWSSALANSAKTSFFYPSVGLSSIVSDMVKLPDFISYLKLRAAYSIVGNTLPRQITSQFYTVSPAGFNINANLPLTTLEPEKTHSTELGVNTQLFKGKIGLDVTLYNANTFNQFFTLQAPTGSGISNYYMNAGHVNNKGIEALLSTNTTVGKMKWNSSLAFTLNRNKIIDLISNKTNPLDGTIINMDQYPAQNPYLKKGGSIGDMFANGVKTDALGYIIVEDPSRKLFPDPNNPFYVGNTNPKYGFGFRNEFSYKGLSLGFLVDFRYGGVVQSATQSYLDMFGASLESARARENNGVLVNGSRVDAQTYYQSVGGEQAMAFYIYSATNARLREASISYTIPANVFNNKINGITLSLIGRNLFMFYNKAPFDPEITAATGTYYQGVDNFMLPSLRSFGFSVKIGL
ncbi:MAG: pfeA 4 [Sphingobacterium sp.]|jgi:TonB-linked SusC/RagA family outer membrane protein|nr:pfeA 4 [Sphingobacterium sp.]